MKRNLVIFDFCDTIANFQTADGFVEFVLGHLDKSWRHFYYFKVLSLLKKLRFYGICFKFFPKGNIEKRCKVFALKGLKKNDLSSLGFNYFVDRITLSYNQDILLLLRKHKTENDILVVSSGGYDVYLKDFCKAEHVDFLNATKLEYKSNKCTGFFEGKDCMFEEKVIQIKKVIKENNLKFDKKIVYSDSISDMPLFKWADQAIVVSTKEQVWAAENGFKQIYV